MKLLFENPDNTEYNKNPLYAGTKGSWAFLGTYFRAGSKDANPFPVVIFGAKSYHNVLKSKVFEDVRHFSSGWEILTNPTDPQITKPDSLFFQTAEGVVEPLETQEVDGEYFAMSAPCSGRLWFAEDQELGGKVALVALWSDQNKFLANEVPFAGFLKKKLGAASVLVQTMSDKWKKWFDWTDYALSEGAPVVDIETRKKMMKMHLMSPEEKNKFLKSLYVDLPDFGSAKQSKTAQNAGFETPAEYYSKIRTSESVSVFERLVLEQLSR